MVMVAFEVVDDVARWWYVAFLVREGRLCRLPRSGNGKLQVELGGAAALSAGRQPARRGGSSLSRVPYFDP
jgi:hypothetical protein